MRPTRIQIEGATSEAAKWIPFARKKLALYERQFGAPYQRQLEPAPGVTIRIEHLSEGLRLIHIKAGGVGGYEFWTQRHEMLIPHIYDLLYTDEDYPASYVAYKGWGSWPRCEVQPLLTGERDEGRALLCD